MAYEGSGALTSICHYLLDYEKDVVNERMDFSVSENRNVARSLHNIVE